jgi:hypothetical protein
MVFTSEHKKFVSESYFRNGVLVFTNGELAIDIQRCCLFDRVSAKISKFKLKQVFATKNTSEYSRASVDVRPKSQRLF